MAFFNDIVLFFWSVGDFFLSLYNTITSWVWPFNLIAGAFLSLTGFFHKLSWQFYYLAIWCQTLYVTVAQVYTLPSIISYFQTWIKYATDAWNWITNWLSFVGDYISQWWQAYWPSLQTWIDQRIQWAVAQINSLVGALAEVQTWWNSFKINIPSLNEILLWFTNWWAAVLSKLNLWWIDRLLDIKALFDSWALDLAPLSTGWQEIRDKVFEFFNDPLEWLLAEFTDWFLGKE